MMGVLRNPARWRWDVLLPTALMAAAVAVLYGMVPYARGYGDSPVTVFFFASRLWEHEDWQHCVLVPFAVGFILWADRRRLAALPAQGTWLGLPVVMFAMALYWFGQLADIIYVGYATMQALLAGLVLLFLGWGWMRALFFPWLFLGFMWPLPFLDNFLAFPLRVVMSQASAATLNAIGVPSVLSGTAILSASDPLTGKQVGQLFSVDVADPCSGIRSLFALMMVSALYGHFTLQSWWKQGILFLASMPLAVLGNLFRILMLTFGTLAFGAEVAIGSLENPSLFHMLAGYLVFAVALAGMAGLVSLLQTKPMAWIHKLGRARRREILAPPPRPRAPSPSHDAY